MNIFIKKQGEKIEDVYDKAYKSFLVSAALTYTIFSVYFISIGSSPLNWMDGFIAIYHFFLLFIPLKMIHNRHFPLLVAAYVVFSVLACTIIAIIYAKSGQITAIIWIFLIPLGATVFDTRKNKAMIWILITIVSTAAVLILTPFFPDSFGVTHLTEDQKDVVDILTVVLFLMLLSLFVYYKDRLSTLRLEMAQKESGKKPLTPKITEEKISSRDDKIYADILSLFEKNKPYCNPNYTIADLAVALNTNVRYVSLALRNQNFDNFSSFINTFRIRLVKEMLNSDFGKTYTLQHIYTSAGFSNQSTFNKAFRLLENITPSEYITKKNSEISAD
jgi:AraC-like DNA-binding protein